MSDSDSSNDDQQFSGSDLGSDFGEMEAEYEVDDDGNPINAKGVVSSSGTEVKLKSKSKSTDDAVDPETRKKQKRLEKLDKKIKSLSKRHEKEGTVKMTNPAEIKNKQKRQEIVLKKRMADRRQTKLEQLKTQKLREELGEEAVPKK